MPRQRKENNSAKKKSDGNNKSVSARRAAPAASVKQRIAETGEHFQEQLHEAVDTAVTGVARHADTYVQLASDRIREIEQTGHEAARKLSPQQPDILTHMIDYLADQIGEVADYFERRDARDVLDDTRQFVRKHPVPAAGAFALLGVTAARYFLAGRNGSEK